MLARLKHLIDTLQAVRRLPRAQLHFERSLNPPDIAEVYRRFTAPHPRYKIIAHKTIGVALLPLRSYADPAAYLAGLRQHGKALALARKARGLGYQVGPLVRAACADDIHAIHTSQSTRQGRPMDAAYQQRQEYQDNAPNFRCLGVRDASGRLAAYCAMARYGNFTAFSQLMGLRNNDGAMHLLLVDIVCQFLQAGDQDYLMYDTYFGAQPGMQRFKSMFGFQPYRVRYTLS